MKWQKFEAIRKQHPWIKQFVGTLEMNTNRKNDIWDKKQEKQKFRDWVEKNLDWIIFRPVESLRSQFGRSNFTVHRLEEGNKEKNLYYPHIECRIYYILFHVEGAKPFMQKFCVDLIPIEENIEWLLKKRPYASKVILDGVVEMIWSARTVSGKMQQRLDIWLLPENFTP
jgi:hypothetical protein